MIKTPNDAQPTVIPMAEVAVSTGDNDRYALDHAGAVLTGDDPYALHHAPVAVLTDDNDPYALDHATFVGVGSVSGEPQIWVVVSPSGDADSDGFIPVVARETTHLDAFCDLWALPDGISSTPVEVGYAARLHDAQRIQSYFNKAMAAIAELSPQRALKAYGR